MTSLPWSATDLPLPQASDTAEADPHAPVLLSPAALRDLIRFLHRDRPPPTRATP
jgi:hypothetical protein